MCTKIMLLSFLKQLSKLSCVFVLLYSLKIILAMKETFAVTRTSREVYKGYFEKYSYEQLNKIPQGFSNNLIWNIGHIIVSQQLLVYAGSNQPMMVSETLVNKYRRGTKPEHDATPEEIEEIKNLLFSTIEKTEDDYEKGLFTGYNERTSRSEERRVGN